MLRSLFLSLTLSGVLFGMTGRADAQTFVRRPNGNNTPYRSQYQPYGITRSSANSPQPTTRFRASPVYPNTTFWSNQYPNSPNLRGNFEAGNGPMAPSWSPNDLGGGQSYGGPAYYPWSDIPLSGGQLGPQPR